jgi:hypothetical protein
MFEFVNGQESHSSYWGKFYVKGLEKYQVKEDFGENIHTKHESYQGYCAEVPQGELFTIFEQSGNKRGTDEFYFFICKSLKDDGSVEGLAIIRANYGAGYISGKFEIIAQGIGKIKAPRLMGWWLTSQDQSLEFAKKCDIFINKRGCKEIPDEN